MTSLSQNGAGAVLSWDDHASSEQPVQGQPQIATTPVNELPPEAVQLVNYLHMANAFLQNPTVAVLAKYAGHPQALINGMPNMVLATQMKMELAELAAGSQPERIRIRCHECGTVNTISPKGNNHG